MQMGEEHRNLKGTAIQVVLKLRLKQSLPIRVITHEGSKAGWSYNQPDFMILLQ